MRIVNLHQFTFPAQSADPRHFPVCFAKKSQQGESLWRSGVCNFVCSARGRRTGDPSVASVTTGRAASASLSGLDEGQRASGWLDGLTSSCVRTADMSQIDYLSSYLSRYRNPFFFFLSLQRRKHAVTLSKEKTPFWLGAGKKNKYLNPLVF